MKVNTDGVLLGASVHISPEDRNFLDVGTGTGTIALMVAQRFFDMHHGEDGLAGKVRIDAIDIDGASASEAGENFSDSPWHEVMHSYNMSLAGYSALPGVEYDLIFSNPPYFDSSLEAPEQRRNASRHTSSGLSYKELAEFASVRLSENGRLAVVLPAEQEGHLLRHARMCGLFLQSITRIRTVPHKAYRRIVAEFSRSRCSECAESVLTIQNEGKYTSEYISLMRDFYLQF